MEPQRHYTIGEAASASGVSVKMIRHYEALGLLPGVRRSGSGYRQYTPAEVHSLRFIRRARDLGFGMSEIGTLLGLWQNRRRSSSEVKRLALMHAAELATRIEEMLEMKRSLELLAQRCHGDDRPDCPILGCLAERSRPPATLSAGRRVAPRGRFR
mgnify:CR=1 FL=1